ncbi:MAG: DNA cytosine methyltransferase [Bacteriovoracaceae bacterium]|nr:DNA cytosine methyltransferase [Bacteriovoracaceae bacterium]
MKSTFVDLFCGAGGFSAGLEKSGMECLLGIDFDKHAINTFKANHPKAIGYQTDIKSLTRAKLMSLLNAQGHKSGTVDVVVGGPPCQGFSTVGRGESSDARNHLFAYFVQVVKWLEPKIVIFENVTGLLAGKNEKVLHSIFQEFEKLGYAMHAQILDAHFYEVPSARRRTFIIGSKLTAPKDLIPPFVTDGRDRAIWNLKEGWKKYLKNAQGKILNHDIKFCIPKNKTTQEILAHIPEGKGIRYEEDELKYLPKNLRLGIDWKKMPENRLRQKKFHRLSFKTVAPTILTSSKSYFHPKENRYLTVREVAACQSFPGDFEFMGPVSSQYRQIGNAVPPRLAYHFGIHIQKFLQHPLTLRPNVSKTKRDPKMKQTTLSQIQGLRSKAFVYDEKSGSSNDK